jgi:hypothetical protein
MKRSFGWFSFTVLSTVNEKLGTPCVLCVLNERSEWAVNMAFLLHTGEFIFLNLPW